MNALYALQRYKIRGDDPGDDVEGEKPRKRVPAKVMWYALWRKIDRVFKDFAADARNIRFGWHESFWRAELQP